MTSPATLAANLGKGDGDGDGDRAICCGADGAGANKASVSATSDLHGILEEDKMHKVRRLHNTFTMASRDFARRSAGFQRE